MAGYDRRQALTLLGLGALGAMNLGASSCAPQKRVLVIGDSLTIGCVRQDLGAGHPWDWIVSAESGRTTNEGIAIAQHRTIGSYNLVIVALGSNDYQDTEAVYGTRIDNMMKALTAAPKVIWINVDTAATKLTSAAFGVNPAIEDAPKRHAKLTLGDWNRYLRARADAATHRAADGIHYRDSGYALRARWMESLVSG